MSFPTEQKFNETVGEELLQPDENQSQFMGLEGECRIDDVRPMRLHHLGRLIATVTLFLIASLVVIGLLALRYSKKFRARLFYQDCQYAEATQLLITGNDGTTEIEDTFIESSGRKVFYYRKMKYCRGRSKYHPVGYSASRRGHIFNQTFHRTGLTTLEVGTQREQFGWCEHKVEVPTYFEYIGTELIKPFFILQYVVCVSYILEQNYLFAIVMLVFSFITTTVNYIMLRLSYKKIKEIAEHSALVEVLRDGVKVKVNSNELVPGDMFSPEQLIPCDCVLISGEVYVNEASLTGENIPIGKFPALAAANLYEDNCWLFEGAKVLELRGNPTALVVNTGFSTRKGRIFRKILHNNPTAPEFMLSAIKFLAIMFLCAYIIYFGFVAFMLQHQLSPTAIFYRALDLIGWAAPAAFPIFFNLCYSVGLSRLRSSKIYGTQPQKTIVAGKIKTMCFDKTGTLTMNSMSLYSIHRILDENTLEEIVASQVEQKDAKDIMYKLFASCHTVRKIQDEFMGDELDLRMFQFAGFSFELSEKDVSIRSTVRRDGSHIDVLRINQFESKFQCMSVLVHDKVENKFYAFVKGAAEKMERSSINRYSKYDDLISSLSLAGLRNIAFAYKQVSQTEVAGYLTCKREEFQKGLTLLGVVAFENKLKDDTVQTLRKLMDAHIEPKIITGDNIFIAVETALRTGILPHGSKILLFEGRKQRGENGKYNGIILTHDRVKSHSQPVEMTHEEYQHQHLPIGIDNDFLHLSPPPELPSTVKLFARISPESKAAIVRRLKQKHRKIDINHQVGMCGDGANDLMAIKEADAGMGISDTDSSFAANFSIPELKGVEHIIRDGKATLSNVREIFIYYGATSFMKVTSSFVMMYDITYLTGNQITFYNYSGNILLAVLLAFSGPADALSSLIPNDNFMGWENALIYTINWVIPTTGLILSEYFLWTQPFFTPLVASKNQWNYTGYTNTIVLLFLQLTLANLAISIYVAKPYKKLICWNIALTVLLTLDFIVYTALYFITKFHFMGVVELQLMFAGGLFGIALGTTALTMILTTLVKLYHQKKSERHVQAEDNSINEIANQYQTTT